MLSQDLAPAPVLAGILASIEVSSHLQVFQTQAPSLALMKKKNQELPKAYLVLALKELDDFYNLGDKGLTGAQIESLARLILANYHYLTLADLRLFVDQFRLGKLADTGRPALYGRLDGGTILEALNRYTLARDEAAAQQSRAQSEQHKTGLIDHTASGQQKAQAISLLEKMAQAWDESSLQQQAAQACKLKPIFISPEAYAKHTGQTLMDVQAQIRQEAQEAYLEAGSTLAFEDYLTFVFQPEWLLARTKEQD